MTFAVLFSSCEQTINVDLNNVTPRIVIEGVVTDQPGPYTVRISKTGDFFAPNVFPTVSGAVVSISDNKGNSETLIEKSPGIYQTASLKGGVGNTYTLTVNALGKEYKASATIQNPIKIDSITYQLRTETGPGSGGGPDRKPGFNLHCFFIDPSGTRDYCFLKLFVNGVQNDNYYLYNGKFNTEPLVDYNRFRHRFAKNDTIRIELLTVEFPVFDYFSTLENIMGGEGMRGIVSTGTPQNPNTNFSNGALGYFAAYSVQADSVVLK